MKFLVGENGSGKSTLVEAIAEAAGLDARGGRAGDFGYRRVAWTDLAIVDHWRRYLSDPAAYLHHLIDP